MVIPAAHHVNRQLVAHYHARQVEVSRRADAAANAADRAIGSVWRRLLDVIRTPRLSPWDARQRGRTVLRDLAPAARQSIAGSLERIARWGHRSAAANLAKTIPVKWLQAAATRPVHEDIEVSSPLQGDYTQEELRDLFAHLLFPPPTLERILQVMNNQRDNKPTWLDQLARSTKLAAPDMLADILSIRYAAGDTQQQIARALMPAVDNVRVSARRIARTEGLRIAHAMQMEAHESLGPLLDGYQIHSVLGKYTRPAHRARHLSTWHKDDPETMQQALHMDGPTLPDGFN